VKKSLFLTGVHRGEEIRMHGDVARPLEANEPPTPVLLKTEPISLLAGVAGRALLWLVPVAGVNWS
jgi:hypothetical protein